VRLVDGDDDTIKRSQVFAGQNVGVKEVSDRIWIVTFMHYDPRFFDHETCRLETVDNPFEPKVLSHVSGGAPKSGGSRCAVPR
jgi:hypothetical protein